MKSWVVAILCAPFLIAVPLQAGPTPKPTPAVWVVFKDMANAEITAVNGKYNLAASQRFQAQVWFQTSVDWNYAELAVRYGTADVNGNEIDHNFRLDGTYVNPAVFNESLPWGSFDFAQEPGGDHPWVNFTELSNSDKLNKAGTSYLGFVYTFTNTMMLAGQTGNISIFCDPTLPNLPFGTRIAAVNAPNITYQMNTIPEPSSLMAMGCAGVGVLGNLLHRRRKKTAAKN